MLVHNQPGDFVQKEGSDKIELDAGDSSPIAVFMIEQIVLKTAGS